ncbi:MAG: tRNA lysidine(34) synthetase TilS [Eubacteriales bacterium]|nr:tRNA lysidine(34) synthetase TilS [Eubacteriales bacterium]
MTKYNNGNAHRRLEDAVGQIIEKYNMLEQCNNLIVGLSGGADSVCLLLVMKEYIEKKNLNIKLHAIHVNHGIRGEEADEDQKFSQRLCAQLGVDFSCERVDIPRLAEESRQTEEEAGRNARYAIFERKAQELFNAKVAVAHHMNDQAETVIMNMLRGSSLKGMCGILPVRGRIIRPLLNVTRENIEEYLRELGQPYVIDQTNMDNEYTRNKIRSMVIPFLEKNVTPHAVDKVCEMAGSIQEVEEYIEFEVAEAYDKCVRTIRHNENEPEDILLLAADEFLQLPPVIGKGVIHKALVKMAGAAKDIYKTNIEDVYELFNQQVDKKKSLPYKLSARRDYDGVTIGHAKYDSNEQEKEFQIDITSLADTLEPGVQVRLPLEQMIYMAGEGAVYISNIVLELQESVDFSLNNDYTKVFDYDRMKDNLVFRFRRAADRMVVTADGQTRKLKKEFIDRKIPKELRKQVMLLAAGSEVYWAVGVRRSEACLIDSATKSILRVTFE